MSDDFYGLMDDGEGQMIGGMDGIDIAVGRMLVSSISQANEMVDKVIEYHDEEKVLSKHDSEVIKHTFVNTDPIEKESKSIFGSKLKSSIINT